MIKVFGDSHALMFGPEFGVHCGAITAYNLDNKHNDLIFPLLKKHNVIKRPIEKVGFLFGEVDCRLHIYNLHMTTGEEITNLIYNAVEKYMNYLIMLEEEKICEPVVYCLVPTGIQDNIYNYIHHANYEKRKMITIIFNHYLSVFCKKHLFIFINYFNLVSDIKGNRLEKYIKDRVHLNQDAGKMITNFTESIFLHNE